MLNNNNKKLRSNISFKALNWWETKVYSHCISFVFTFNIQELNFLMIVFLHNFICSCHVHITFMYTSSSINASKQAELMQWNTVYISLFLPRLFLSSCLWNNITTSLKSVYLLDIYYLSRWRHLAWASSSASSSCCSFSRPVGWEDLFPYWNGLFDNSFHVKQLQRAFELLCNHSRFQLGIQIQF